MTRSVPRWLYATYAIFATVTAAAIVVINLRMYAGNERTNTMAQLAYLERTLADGAGERMQRVFPEGYVFTWALYGLASVEMLPRFPAADPNRTVLLGRGRDAIAHVSSETARATFSPQMNPPYGAFYNGWSLYLRAKYLWALQNTGDAHTENPNELLRTFEHDCEAFADALNESSTPFLSSYTGAAWPADTAVGVAALAIHDRLGTAKYQTLLANWVADARARENQHWHALSHVADSETGLPLGGVRGSSLALMSRVLIDVDPSFAAEQYRVLRARFVASRNMIPGVLEYPEGVSGTPDIDSGPLLLGYSGPAVVVGAAAARVHGDEALAEALFGSVEVAGFASHWRTERQYLFGNVPVGDAFIAWAHSVAPPVHVSREPSPISRSWRWPWHIFSLLLLTVLAWPLRRNRHKVIS